MNLHDEPIGANERYWAVPAFATNARSDIIDIILKSVNTIHKTDSAVTIFNKMFLFVLFDYLFVVL